MMRILWELRAVIVVAAVLSVGVLKDDCIAQSPAFVPSPAAGPAMLPPPGQPIQPHAPLQAADPFWNARPKGYAVIAGPKVIELGMVGEPYNHRPMDVQRTEPYAYGWFGGVDRSKWHRQFGPHRRYTQWSLR